MQIVIDISKKKYDEIMSMDWVNCRRFFDEELRAIHDGKVLEPYDGCISRQAAIDLADELKDDLPDNDRLSDMVISHNEGILEYQTKLSLLPPVTPAKKVGRWKYGEDNLGGTGRDGWYCNQCGHFEFWDYSMDMKSAKLNLPNLCPNCGKKMEVAE